MKILLRLFLFVMAFYWGGCQKNNDALGTWTAQSVPVDMDISSIWFTDTLNGFAVGGRSWDGGCILSTADGGTHWAIDTLFDFKMEHVMADQNGRVYAVGQAGVACERPVGSRYWNQYRQDYRWHRGCFTFDDTKAVIVSGESLGLGEIRTLGPEYFWELDSLQDFPNQLQAVWATDRNTWFVCGLGWVLRSADGGYTWKRSEITGDFFCSIHFPTASTGYICGSSGTILKTTDGGTNWSEIRKGGAVGPAFQLFSALWFESEISGWVCGGKGLLWHTKDGGKSWDKYSEPSNDLYFTDVFVKDGHGWVTAEGGQIFRFSGGF